MSIKKYSNGQWVDIPYRKYETATDTITTLPKTLYADGQSASANIKGNMQQSGTPSPQSIIMPDECGNKTANLCNESTLQNGYFGTLSNFPYTADDKYRCFSMELSAGTYTIFAKSNDVIIRLLRVSSNSLGANAVNKDNQAYTFTLSATEIIYVSMRNSTTTNNFTGLTIMLNTGSTALPYQPNGDKIPILSGGTTTNVYLGEVQSTRQIKKLVLTGQENWTYESSFSRFSTFGILTISFGARATPMYCSHFQVVDDGRAIANVPNNSCYSGNVGTSGVYFKVESYTSADDFKAYVAQQYASGTPITLWVILAEPTTGIVNEPIRKIGTYADSVSVTGIPTTGTAEQFNIDTDLKPSEVDLTYHGWHEHSDTKFT